MKINISEEELIALLSLAFIHGKNDFPEKQFKVLRERWIEKVKK